MVIHFGVGLVIDDGDGSVVVGVDAVDEPAEERPADFKFEIILGGAGRFVFAFDEFGVVVLAHPKAPAEVEILLLAAAVSGRNPFLLEDFDQIFQ